MTVMRLVIIPIDQKVNKDGVPYEGLNLSDCGIPQDVHALQWFTDHGWIEYESPLVQNEDITALPEWALNCLAVWQAADDAHNQPIEPLVIPDNIVV